MKALSLYQPWAQLVVIGAKKFETRSWATAYRGRLLIHASKRFPREGKKLCSVWPFVEALRLERDLPTGVILGWVDLVDCMTTEAWIVTHRVYETEDVQEEYRFGDYGPGRFAWRFENPARFDLPIPAKGSLGIWEFPESALGPLASKS